MNLVPLLPSQVLNDAYRKQSLSLEQVEKFKKNIIILFSRINDSESEEHNKNIIADFLKDTYYKTSNEINTNQRKDLVIHNGPKATDAVGVIIEAKKPGNAEMITAKKPNTKALHELVHYYLHERIYKNNAAIKHLVATNVYDWFVFDAQDFEKLFYQNKNLVKSYKEWNDGTLAGDKTDWLYIQLLKPFIEKEIDNLNAAYFNLNKIKAVVSNADKADDEQLVDLYKILSGEHLLKQSFANDSNSLNKEFYNELLHIIGLEEKKDGSKKLIDRKTEDRRNDGSLLENSITILQSRSRTAIPQHNIFSTALELCINWLNRILFLKLMEGQLIQYHNGDKQFAFLNNHRIKDFDELDELFFEVLALPVAKRSASVNTKFANIPYLNSSLFEPTENEKQYAFISSLKGRLELPLYSSTVLKDNNGKRISGNKNSLHYLFEFLDAYDFASDKASLIKEDNKTIINASVLGLIFEKINGYKDGSFFTPGFITMYMCRETLRRAVVQKFKEAGGKTFENIEDYEELKDKIDYSNKVIRSKVNELINSIKICDPAVGSGHFLVSALNEMIAIKSDLRILSHRNGNRCSAYKITVANDELIIKNTETDKFFAYLLNQNNKPIEELQEVQEMLFHEKQTIIENCLFGVDINPKSVMICQLRLWIELLKNAYYIQGVDGVLETLPNIDINIKCGNSLISRFKLDADLSDVFKNKRFSHQAYLITVTAYKNAKDKVAKDELKQFLTDIKKEFLSTVLNKHPYQKDLSKLRADLTALDFTDLFGLKKLTEAEANKKKKALQKDIDVLDAKVEEYRNAAIYKDAFEWRFEFPEVLDDDGNYKGFDVVIGNPPYFPLSKIKEQAAFFVNVDYKTFSKGADIYCLFYERGNQLLKQEGFLSYITSNSWLKAIYGDLLKKYFAENMQPINLLNIEDIQIFDEATVESNIIILQKLKAFRSFRVASLSNNYIVGASLSTYFYENSFQFKIPQTNDWFIGNEQNGILKKKIENCSKLLKNFDIKINFGIKTGFNEAFIINENERKIIIEKDSSSAEIIKPIIRGRDLKKYNFEFKNLWIIISKYRDFETIINKYPEIFKRLNLYKEKLEKRGQVVNGQHHWLELDNNPTDKYFNLFNKPKIIWGEISDKPKFAYDDGLYYAEATTFLLTGENLKYLLAVLNSKISEWYFNQISTTTGMGTNRWKKYKIELLPIKEADKKSQLPFITLVDKILTAKKENPQANTSAWEKEIDAMVYKQYELTDEEIKIVEE